MLAKLKRRLPDAKDEPLLKETLVMQIYSVFKDLIK